MSYYVVDGVPVLMPPPPGYEVDFANPKQQHATVAYIVFGACILLSTFFFAQYVYVKLWLIRKFDVQLACLAVGWCFSVAIQAIEIRNFSIKIIGVHIWEMPITNAVTSSYYLVIVPILTSIMTCVCKTSLGLFYYHLSPKTWWKWASGIILFLLAGHNIAILIAILLGCRPFKKNWNSTIPGTCINRPALYIVTAALGVFSDLVLLIVPIPMIVGLQMPRRQKIGLIAFFAIGSATLVTAMLRLIFLIPTLGLEDITWKVSSTAVVILAESNLLVICAALPTLRRFFAHIAPRMIGERGSSARKGASGESESQQRSFRTIGDSVENRKRVDEFGMTINEEDIYITTITPPNHTEPQGEARHSLIGQAFTKDGDERSHIASRDSSLDNFLWDSRVGNDDLELQRVITHARPSPEEPGRPRAM